MKNSEKPINPLPSNVDSSKVECKGLTKREYFAGLAMQGLLTRVQKRDNNKVDLGILECKRIVDEAVIMADELLKQLEIK